MDFIADWINVAALLGAWAIGYVIKHAVNRESVDRFIPLICMLVGIVVVVCGDYADGVFNVDSIVMGAISGLSATGLYEAIKNIIEKAGSGVIGNE